MKRALGTRLLSAGVLLAALEVCGQPADSAQAAAYFSLRPSEPIAWGDPVDALSVGIGAIRTFHGAKSDLIISAYLANRGTTDIRGVIRSANQFIIECDGRYYRPPSRGGPSGRFDPGVVFPAILLVSDRFKSTPRPDGKMTVNGDSSAWAIAPGRHVIRIHYGLARSAAVTIEVPSGSTGDSNAAVSALVELAAREDTADDERRLAVEGLQRLRGEAAVTGMVARLNDRDSSVRSSAARALVAMNATSAVPALSDALSDTDAAMRAEIARALGALGDRAAIESLQAHLDDPIVKVRLEVLTALINLGEPPDLVRISEVIRTKSANEFQAAIWLVRRHAPAQAVRTLISCLDFDDPSGSSYYNHTLVWQIAACGGPVFSYHHDFDGNSTEADVAENRRILDALRATLSHP